jgi:hypothetical protein
LHIFTCQIHWGATGSNPFVIIRPSRFISVSFCATSIGCGVLSRRCELSAIAKQTKILSFLKILSIHYCCWIWIIVFECMQFETQLMSGVVDQSALASNTSIGSGVPSATPSISHVHTNNSSISGNINMGAANAANANQHAILSPPEMFAQVEPDVYRTKQIYPHNFEFLKRLKLRTLVKLTSEAPFKAVVSFCDENDIQLVHLGAKKWKADTSWKPITEELVKEALEIALDRTRHPVMLMCSSGMHQTATVVACLRRLQHWNMTSILVEMSLGFTNSKFSNEQFVELFDTDLVTLPQHLPEWFVDQEAMWLAEKQERARAIEAAPAPAAISAPLTTLEDATPAPTTITATSTVASTTTDTIPQSQSMLSLDGRLVESCD